MILWLGHEREGDFLGLYTLFIGSDKVTVSRIADILDEHPKIKQLYFGAGICTHINQNVVWQCLKLFPKLKIMLEVRFAAFDMIDTDLYDKVNFILTINENNLLNIKQMKKTSVQIKIQSVDYDDKIVMLQNVKKFNYTDMSDFKEKTYEKDVVLE